MIYFTSADQCVVILEPSNIERLKKGEPISTPDKKVLIAYTPNIVRFGEEMQKQALDISTGEIDVEIFDSLLKESLNWPEVKDRPYEPLKQVIGRKLQ